LQGFETALKRFQTYIGDPIDEIESVLAREPEFVLGHLFRAVAYYVTSERRYQAPAQASVTAARALLGHANEREKRLFGAVEKLVSGEWDAACRGFDRVLQQFPTDIFALQSAHLIDFLGGDALNLRNRPGRVLPEWDRSMPGYSYVLGMYAFGLEESNQYTEAEAMGRRALEIDPVDAWSVHAVVHVMEMQGRAEEGAAFLYDREKDWAMPDNAFAFHNWWHLGLMLLEQRRDDEALDVFDRHIFAEADDAMLLVDVTAMLWRLRLIGMDVADRIDRVADVWAGKIESEAGYYAFNDFHAALAFAAAGRPEMLAVTERGLGQAACGGGSNRYMSSAVGVPLVRGIAAYESGNYDDAIQLLSGVRDIANRFGGSHAQRDLINLTLLSAAQRGGAKDLVRHLSNERSMFKPSGSVLGERVLQSM
jgi:tetratricopeptide (TPR) repeat protein